MDLTTYMEKARRTRKDLGSVDADVLHMVLGLMDEVGELTKNVKKNFVYGAELNKENIVEELGDISWFWIGMCDVLNINPDTVLSKNISKLKARYPDKYTDEKALDRNLDKEKNALQGYSELDFLSSLESEGL